MQNRRSLIIVTLALVVLASEQTAQAYTDPGSGMLIVQLLGSAALGALFYFQRIRNWLAAVFRGSKSEQK
jgi:hypothetical protein